MSEATSPGTTTASPDVEVATASARATPEPASSWVDDHAPPATEAERQAQETVRSVSRLEESN